MLVVAEHRQPAEYADAEAPAGVLEERVRTYKAMKLLGECLARKGPEARPCAAT